MAARVGNAQQAAVTEAVTLLRSLGHDVVERAPDYMAISAGWNVTARYLRGVYDDVATMPHPERLEARTRSMARAGRLISDERIEKLRAPTIEHRDTYPNNPHKAPRHSVIDDSIRDAA